MWEDKPSKQYRYAFVLIQNVTMKCVLKTAFHPFPFPLTSPASSLSQMGPEAQAISSLPYRGSNDIGEDSISKLTNFHFLLSCFRRDSHKIDSFLKVLRCRAAKLQPEMC